MNTEQVAYLILLTVLAALVAYAVTVLMGGAR